MTKKAVRWCFRDGRALAMRIRREYAQRLLDRLPFVPDDMHVSKDLQDGYRLLVRTMVDAARLHQRLSDVAITSKGVARAQAQAARAAWRLVHLHLVACELQVLWQTPGQHDELELVLLAEYRVEQLAESVAEQP